jgi:hypothetical protein
MSYTITTSSNSLFDLYDTFDSISSTQIEFEFEYVDEDGTVTETDVNMKPDPNIGSLSIANGPYAISSSILVGGSGGSGAVWATVTDSTSDRLDKIEAILRQIQDRLLIIEDLEETELKQTLRKAYEKFRMLEDMAGKKQ